MPPEVDGIEVRPGKAETNLLESLQPPPATAGAPSPQQPGPTPDPAVPKGADAAFLDQLFAVGNASMSGDDILSTIETIQAMEAIIISSLERQLKSPPLQTRAKRGTLKKIFDPMSFIQSPKQVLEKLESAAKDLLKTIDDMKAGPREAKHYEK